MYFFLLFWCYLPKGPRTHICKNKIYLPKNTLFWLELVSWVEIDALVLILQKIFKCFHCSIFQFLLLSLLLAGNNRLNKLEPRFPKMVCANREEMFSNFYSNIWFRHLYGNNWLDVYMYVRNVFGISEKPYNSVKIKHRNIFSVFNS